MDKSVLDLKPQSAVEQDSEAVVALAQNGPSAKIAFALFGFFSSTAFAATYLFFKRRSY